MNGGSLECRGANEYGQVGCAPTGRFYEHLPIDVFGFFSGATLIAAGQGSEATCAIASGGTVSCWGWNEYGCLGDGTDTKRAQPVAVVGLSSGVTSLGLGRYHTCAVTAAGGVQCWGANDAGQLGDGTNTESMTPVYVKF